MKTCWPISTKRRPNFSKLLERAIHGEDVVISKAGAPVAMLVGIDRYKPKRDLGFAGGAFTMSSLEDFNAPLDPETLAFLSRESDSDSPGLKTLWF